MKVYNPLPPGSLLTIDQHVVFNGTSPSTWQDLDLSTWVGPRPAMAYIKCNTNGSGKAKAFRKNGDTDEFYNVFADGLVQVADSQGGIHYCFIVMTDNAGIIEWKTETAETLIIDIVGWIA